MTTTRIGHVSVGGSAVSVTGPTTGTEVLTTTTWNLRYVSTGFQRVPYDTPADPDNYTISNSASVEYASLATESSEIVDTDNVINIPGRVLLWVSMKTNNVVSVQDWVYDDPASVKTSLLTANGAQADATLNHASWNPRTGELATSDELVQWV